MRRRLRGLAAIGIAAGAIAATASPAGAVTIGQIASTSATACTAGPVDAVQLSTPSPSSYVVPPSGATISSWSTLAAPGPNQTLSFKVFRNVAGLTYTVVGHDGPRALTPAILNTFSGFNIHVKPGDVIGLNTENSSAAPTACYATVAGATIGAALGDLSDGLTGNFGSPIANGALNLTAEVNLVTGKRAKALKKCKHKHGQKRKKCKKKAKKLPL